MDYDRDQGALLLQAKVVPEPTLDPDEPRASFELTFDTFASLLDAFESHSQLDPEVALQLDRGLNTLRRGDASYELALNRRGRERSVVFDARSLRWLQRVVRKQLEKEMYSPDEIEEQVNVGEIAGVRGRLVRVARQSALPELRAALEELGFTCYEVDGSRIVDRRSFEDETARAGIFDEWEFLLRDWRAILWLAADQLFELNPIALLEAVHGLLSEWTEREQIELFLLGEGRLVEASRIADLDSHRVARGGPPDEERLSSFLFSHLEDGPS